MLYKNNTQKLYKSRYNNNDEDLINNNSFSFFAIVLYC